MESTLYLTPATVPQFNSVEQDSDLETCTAIAWLDLVAWNGDDLTGDDWLALCNDIDTGEIYRDWFLWQDREVSGDWEAYDPLSDRRFISQDLGSLKAGIDRIEDARNSAIAQLEWSLETDE